MDLTTYQKKAHEFATYGETLLEKVKSPRTVEDIVATSTFLYPSSKLAGEAGEIAAKLVDTPADEILDRGTRYDFLKEFGDVLWYLAEMATNLRVCLFTVVDGRGGSPIDEVVSDRALRLCGHACGVTETMAKLVRDKGISKFEDIDDASQSKVEQGIVSTYWALTDLAASFYFTMGEVAQANVEKLSGRKDRGTLLGSGDNR